MSVVFTFVSHPDNEQSRAVPRAARHGVSPALVWRAGFQAWQAGNEGRALAATDAASLTDGKPLQIVITHAAGEIDPVTAARTLAAMQLRSNGRIALRVPARGQTDTDQQPSHIAFWRRIDEYLTLLKRLWANEKPIDHEGPFYSVAGGFVPRKGACGITMPIRMGGLSGTALNVVGKHADVFELAGGSPDEVGLVMGRARAAAARHGRQGKIRFALPVVFGAENPEKPDPGRIVLSRQPAQAAVQVLGLVDVGVSEFLVSGIAAAADLDAFEHVASFVQNSLSRREAAWAGIAGVAAGRFDLVSAPRLLTT